MTMVVSISIPIGYWSDGGVEIDDRRCGAADCNDMRLEEGQRSGVIDQGTQLDRNPYIVERTIA